MGRSTRADRQAREGLPGPRKRSGAVYDRVAPPAGTGGDMRTKDIMTSPVVTVTPDTPLKDVAALLVERGINAVPVADAGNRLCGIVSGADLLTLEIATSGASPPHTAREVMTESVYTLAEDTDAAAAARMMRRHGLRSVPVVSGDRLGGIVARRDLLRLVARGDGDIRADLQARPGGGGERR